MLQLTPFFLSAIQIETEFRDLEQNTFPVGSAGSRLP